MQYVFFPFHEGDSALYEGLKEYIMSEDVLKQNGYPFQHPDHAGYAIQYAEKRKAMADGKSDVGNCQIQHPFRCLKNTKDITFIILHLH